MSKHIALLLVLVLMMAVSGMPEKAVQAMPADTAANLYDLYNGTGAERTRVGTGIPILEEGVLIISPAVLPAEPEHLEVWDGTAFRNVLAAIHTSRGKLTVLLYETEGESSGIPPYSFAEAGSLLRPGELTVRSGNRADAGSARAVYDISPAEWLNLDCVIVTLSGDAEPGSAMLNPEGELAGIVVAEYAEGLYRYIVLTVDQIAQSLMEASDLLAADGTDTNPPEGYKVTVNGNEVTFDWSEVMLPELPEGYSLFHVVADTESSYLTYVRVKDGATSAGMLLTPGRMYESGLMILEDGNIPDGLPGQVVLTALPEAEPLTEHSFQSLVFAIGELAEDAPESAMPVPAEEITEELLRSGRACIYSVTSYDVEEEISGLGLLVTLTSPDGSNFRWESGWVYGPAYKERDEWYVRMSETGLLDLLNQAGYQDGTYEMCMYIDGNLADSFSFILAR